jgi:hypothetical protein
MDGAPVFTDLSGRRSRRMRRFGVGASVALLACLIVMAVGLLGGPRVPVLPWSSGKVGTFSDPSGAAGKARSSPASSAPAPLPSRDPASRPSSPSPSPPVGPARSSPASASPSPSSPATVVTNRAGKAPPGLNRTPQPKHTHAA